VAYKVFDVVTKSWQEYLPPKQITKEEKDAVFARPARTLLLSVPGRAAGSEDERCQVSRLCGARAAAPFWLDRP